MLMAPLPGTARRRTPAPARVRQLASVGDEQEAAGFMAFLGEHQQFAATHKGA